MGNNTKKIISAGIFLLIFGVSYILGGITVRKGTPCKTQKYEELNPSDRGSITGFNLNTATEAALISIKGIGPVYAKSIIETRDKMGKFKSVHDLEYAYGIGERRAEDISKFVRID